MTRSRALIVFCLLAMSACKPFKVSQSADFFLPPELGSRFSELQSFPGAWWSYVVAIRPSSALCATLKNEPGVSRAGCSYSPGDLKDLLTPWLQDYPLRAPPPSSALLMEKMNLSLAKASAPLGAEIVELLRGDPLGTYEELLRTIQALNPLKLEYRGEFLRFPGSDAAAIPVLFDFPRTETDRTASLRQKIESTCAGKCGELFFIGPHFATEKNKAVIKADVERLTWVGALLFSVFLCLLVFSGRWTALLITIPVSLAVAAAGMLVNEWNGQIHGLTIAFGSSLTGIAFDYAFHAFVRNSGVRVWHANLIGYLTTIAVFAVMVFSGIPLVREIMIFALVGITLAFVLFYIAIRLIPERYQIEPFEISPYKSPAAPWLLSASVLVIAACGVFLRPDFSVQNLEQSTERERRVTRELFSSGGALPPVVRVHEAGVPESEFEKEQAFAKEHGLRLVNRLTFLPTLSEQEKHLAAWRALSCGKNPLEKQLSETYRRFFEPFFRLVSCEAVTALRPSANSSYARAIQGEGEARGKWLSTFFPDKAGREAEIRDAMPGAFSIRDLVALFPARMKSEMSWMIPLIFLVIVGIVWLSYGSWKITLAVFIPFLVGAAFAAPALAFSPSGFGFVSLVGMLMVFGTATDFGVFCANFYINSQLTRQGIWTALLISGLVSLLGFLPLLLADHVVLRQLGEPLVLGSIGTLIGTFFVQPWWMRYALAR